MKRAATLLPILLLSAWAPAPPLAAQHLEPSGRADMIAKTVQEVAYLPGNATNPAGWAVIARTNKPTAPFQGVTFVSLADLGGCNLPLGENVQDVTVFEGRVYATLKEGGSVQDALATIDPGTDPCSDAVVLDRGYDPVQQLPWNATNVRVSRLGGTLYARLANSFRAADCGGLYQAEDLAIFLYDLDASELVSMWTPGQDGYARGCDPCGILCGPEDTVSWSADGRQWMAVATLLAGVYIVDVTDPRNPTTTAHFHYTYTGRGFDGTPRPGLPALTGDIEITEDLQYLVTADQATFGGHLIVWRLQDILDRCSDPANPCTGGDVTPVGEYFPDGTPPGFAHKMLPDWPYLWLTYFDYGLVLLDFADPAAPRQVGRYDPLAVHPPDSFGQWGAYGVDLAWPCGGQPSEVLVSDIGIYDSASSPDVEGGVVGLRWTGPATAGGPLRVARDPAAVPVALDFSWTRAPLAQDYRIYAGTIPAVPGPLDDHDVPAIDWCRLSCCAGDLSDPALGPREYFLLRSRDACDNWGDLGVGAAGPRNDPEPTICP